jgi:serine/threonine-protein kinase
VRASTRAGTEVWIREEPGATAPVSKTENSVVIADCFGHYVLFEELATGGIATVHRAMDGERSVMLRRLRPEFEHDWELVAAFAQECQLAMQLQHRGIARTHACGKIDGTYYAATELVAGPTLRDVMIQCRTAAGAMPLRVAVGLLVQLVDAIAYLHAQDSLALIHRDLSPQNLVLSRNGRLVMIDFGVARTAVSTIGRRPSRSKLGYVAPECADGHLDERADLFAVGVIAHELLTGKRLFAGPTDYALARSVREARIPPPSRSNPQVTRDLDDIVTVALRRDPDERWQNARAMGRALRALGPHADADEIRDWTEWAFSRQPRRDTLWVTQMLAAIESR